MNDKKWNILHKDKKKLKTKEDVIRVLYENRKLIKPSEIKEFIDPTNPSNIPVKDVGLKQSNIEKSIKRLEKALKDKEKIIIYGDYDADGICASAILWECLNYLGFDATPFIPSRFEDGYGIKEEGVEKLKKEYPNLGLIITVDNGIVANKAVDKANKLGIDVILTDHHEAGKKSPDAYSIIHTTKIGGAGVAWFFAREIYNNFKPANHKTPPSNSLELACIGTVSDQIPLLGANRSIVKYGIEDIRKTNRMGLKMLIENSGIKKEDVGMYEIGFVIAPRLNAMGRLESAMDSLRLLCIRGESRAKDLSQILTFTNEERKRIVNEVIEHAQVAAKEGGVDSVIILAHEDYHEGVIGLAASKLVEKFYRPAIVFSKGTKISKASARSIPDFNLIENIRKMDKYLIDGGGHTMAAGFSLKTEDLADFAKDFIALSSKILSEDMLKPRVTIDVKIDFSILTWDLLTELKKFEPSGIGNPRPVFSSTGVEVMGVKCIGQSGNHLKLKLRQSDKTFDAIAFGIGEMADEINKKGVVDIAYYFDENVWRGVSSMQLQIKDIKLPN